MALETVAVTVVSDDLVPVPIDGVLVRVFDQTGASFITSGITGGVVPGVVEFTLNGEAVPVVYQLRFFKAGVSFVSPQAIEVYSPPGGSPTGTNTFEVEGHVATLPEAVDPALCRASAYFIGPDGRPMAGYRLQFVFRGAPQVVTDRGVVGERVTILTDKTGYAQIDLIRGACYDVTMASEVNTQREILVPDLPAIHLQRLLFPRVELITWTVATSMVAGTSQVIYPLLTGSDMNALEGAAPDDVEYVSSNDAILSVLVESDRITLTAVAPGTATLTVTRRDASIRYEPDTDIVNGSVTITVS